MAMHVLQAIQERHENSLLKTEMEKLREENKAMRDTINKACCPSCGMATTGSETDTSLTTEEQHLRIENAKLKTEVKFEEFITLMQITYISLITTIIYR